MRVVMDRIRNGLSLEPMLVGLLNHCMIELEHEEGELIIRGKVPSFYQKQMAQEAVMKVINGGEVPYLALTVRNELDVE